MGEITKISWCDHTINWWIGCSKLSPACDGCYAEAMMDHRYGRAVWGGPGKGVGTRSRTSAHTWNDPYRWHRKAEKDGTRPFVFSSSLSDIFDNQVAPQWRADAFKVMRETPRLVYLLLTKRPQNIVKLTDAAGGLPSNAALGTTVEDQPRADINLPALKVAEIELRPLFTFGSFEPLLSGVQIPPAFMPGWIIVGGETDQGSHKARPMLREWAQDLRDQASAAGVPFHMKQWGEWTSGENVPHSVRGKRPSAHWTPGEQWIFGTSNMSDPEEDWMDEPDAYRIGKKLTGRLLDGILHDARPEVPAYA